MEEQLNYDQGQNRIIASQQAIIEHLENRFELEGLGVIVANFQCELNMMLKNAGRAAVYLTDLHTIYNDQREQ